MGGCKQLLHSLLKSVRIEPTAFILKLIEHAEKFRCRGGFRLRNTFGTSQGAPGTFDDDRQALMVGGVLSGFKYRYRSSRTLLPIGTQVRTAFSKKFDHSFAVPGGIVIAAKSKQVF